MHLIIKCLVTVDIWRVILLLCFNVLLVDLPSCVFIKDISCSLLSIDVKKTLTLKLLKRWEKKIINDKISPRQLISYETEHKFCCNSFWKCFLLELFTQNDNKKFSFSLNVNKTGKQSSWILLCKKRTIKEFYIYAYKSCHKLQMAFRFLTKYQMQMYFVDNSFIVIFHVIAKCRSWSLVEADD